MSKPGLGGLMATRCQHNAGDPYYQCGMYAGHKGPHMHESELRQERERNLHPTLEDIRRVVREEIRAALTPGDEQT